MRIRELRCELWLPRPLDEVFAFFADAGNLEILTPPWMNFHILTPRPIEMHVGALIDYRLRVRGIPLRWRSEITDWEPPHRFVDEQRRGPYRLWHHEHTFEPREGGTLCRDAVDYAVPFDFVAHRFLVRPDIQRIFEFRQRKMREFFPGNAEAPGSCRI
ncbi:MAG: SRPBCC family protein [Verrucomicrobiota bacterium]|nr:SRPBCC family protein [Verrucomicrobiota bacterium]